MRAVMGLRWNRTTSVEKNAKRCLRLLEIPKKETEPLNYSGFALLDVLDHRRQGNHFLDGDGLLSGGKVGPSELFGPLLFSFVFAFLFFLSFEKRRI